MNEADYTDRHAHPTEPTVVEIVAYERRDAGWDVFVFEPAGSVPELECRRTDESHIFVERIDALDALDRVAAAVGQRLGAGYEPVPYYREVGTRRVIGRIVDHLRQQGAHGFGVHSPSEGEWELHVRRKDFPLAGQVAAPNTGAEPA